MKVDVAVHQVVLELEEPAPSEVPVASDIVLKVKVSCPCGCDLSGRVVKLMAGKDTLIECVREEFAVNAPKKTGACRWTLLFPRQEIGGNIHEQASLPVAFETTPLGSSLAIWSVPSPVVTGERFKVKVGAESSGGCALSGAKVEILDDAGARIGAGCLGDRPWEGTTGLYWIEVELLAPAIEGIVSWSARFGAQDSPLPHGDANASFSFAAVKPPDHRLTIKLIAKETGKPIENAHIRLGPFRALTDASGLAELSMPKGIYEIKVWHAGYEAPPTTVEIMNNVTLQLIGVAIPQEDPSARWMM